MNVLKSMEKYGGGSKPFFKFTTTMASTLVLSLYFLNINIWEVRNLQGFMPNCPAVNDTCVMRIILQFV